jgi:hypothetical protein
MIFSDIGLWFCLPVEFNCLFLALFLALAGKWWRMIQFVFEITEQELRRIEAIIIINHRVKPYTGVALLALWLHIWSSWQVLTKYKLIIIHDISYVIKSLLFKMRSYFHCKFGLRYCYFLINTHQNCHNS